LKKDYSALFEGSAWVKKRSNEEIFPLFIFFMYLSYAGDFLRGTKIKYDKKGKMEPPVTNLRYFSNYYNLGTGLVFIFLIYMLIRVVIRLILK
jgi:hypothetical protein